MHQLLLDILVLSDTTCGSLFFLSLVDFLLHLSTYCVYDVSRVSRAVAFYYMVDFIYYFILVLAVFGPVFILFQFLLEVCVMRRSKMGRSSSRRLFSNRSGVHPRNNQRSAPMRGGIRL